MTRLNIHEAKTHLSRYIEKVREGEKIILCKNGTPVAQIIPFPRRQKNKKAIYGLGKGLGSVPDSFFDPLTDEDFPGIGLPKRKKSARKK